MASPLNWHLAILPADQRALWEHKLQAGFPGWVLYPRKGVESLWLRVERLKANDLPVQTQSPRG